MTACTRDWNSIYWKNNEVNTNVYIFRLFNLFDVSFPLIALFYTLCRSAIYFTDDSTTDKNEIYFILNIQKKNRFAITLLYL